MEAFHEGQNDVCATYAQVFAWVNKAKTIDAVPVVRCKDCKFAEHYDNTAGAVVCKHPEYSFTYGTTWDQKFHPVVDGKHFCSYGERKANEKE